MELKWIYSFVAVAEELHFRRAAERLHLAQSAVSHHVSSLERSLGTSLFHRSTREVTLTAAGALFLERSTEIIRLLETTQRSVRNVASDSPSHLTIAYNSGFTSRMLTELIHQCLAAVPTLEIEVGGSSTNRRAADQVYSGSVDLGLIAAATVPTGLMHLPLGSARLQLLAADDSGLPPVVSADDLRDTRLILSAPADGLSLRGFGLSYLTQRGLTSPRTLEAGDGISVETLVAGGLGVGFVTSGAHRGTSNDRAGVRIHELADAVSIPVHLIWNPSSIAGQWVARHILKPAE